MTCFDKHNLPDRIIFSYAGKFLADNDNIDNLSDAAFNKTFSNCVMHTKIKNYYPRVRAAIVILWEEKQKQMGLL